VSKDRNTVFRFGVAGFGIVVVVLGFQMLMEPSPLSRLEIILSAIFMILCPPAPLIIPLIDVEIGTGRFYVVWMVVALFNAALYAAIGSAYVGLRKKREMLRASESHAKVKTPG
jgi:hypothetical protein